MGKRKPPLLPPQPPPPSSTEEGGDRPPPRRCRRSSALTPPSISSPSSSSSSSDFEFLVALSPASRSSTSTHFCPADDLFYKGQLLPLHLSPRLTMVRTLLLSSESSSSSSSTTTSRDSSGSSADSTGSFSSDLLLLSTPHRPSSASSAAAADDDDHDHDHPLPPTKLPRSRLSSLATRFSSVFHHNNPMKQVIRKCVKKVKPLYEKISSSHNHHPNKRTFSFSIRRDHHQPQPKKVPSSSPHTQQPIISGDLKSLKSNFVSKQTPREIMYKHSFSGNLRYPRRNPCPTAASCPSSIRSSPTRSGLLITSNIATSTYLHGHPPSSAASMEDLQSAIQGAIAHCKSSLKKETPPPLLVAEQI